MKVRHNISGQANANPSLSAYRLNVAIYTMSSNSYSAIEDCISEACDAIHDSWYSNK